MIWREGFVYERFTLTEPIFEGGLERIGDLQHLARNHDHSRSRRCFALRKKG
jgi:hypothetical protein